MNAPPGLASDAPARWSHRSESRKGVAASRFSALMDRALVAPDLAHLGIRSLQRCVRRFAESELHERDLVSWVIGYADPTGETAVRNVMAGRS